MKFAYKNREFWCKGYYVDTAGKNTKAIKEHIKNQLKQDKFGKQLTFSNTNPFMDSKYPFQLKHSESQPSAGALIPL